MRFFHDSLFTIPPSRSTGFTLIELIMVMVMVGALVAVASVFIVEPFRAYQDVTRRARLVDIADTVLNRMTRELRLALPNSVRLTDNGAALFAIEFLRAPTGGRYRARPNDVAFNILDFTKADSSFTVLGPGGLQTAPPAGSFAVVYNVAATGTQGNAYFGDNRATVGAGSLATQVNLTPAFQFPFSSPNQRVYVVDTPVSYVWNSAAQTLTRYDGYAIAVAQPLPPAGGGNALLADSVSNAVFSYNAGAGTRHGLVSLRIALTDGGETVSLLQQVHVPNTP